MGMRPISKTISGFCLIETNRTTRWDGFLPGGLLKGIANFLIGARFIAAEIMLGLIPIALKGRFGPVPR